MKTPKFKLVDITLIDKVEEKRIRQANGDHILDLAESIKSEGLLQPIAVNHKKTDDGKEEYTLIAGLHRLLACKALEHTTIPAMVYDDEPFENCLTLEITENFKRKNFTHFERCKAIAEFKKQYILQFPETEHGRNSGKNAKPSYSRFLESQSDINLSNGRIIECSKIFDDLTEDVREILPGSVIATSLKWLKQLTSVPQEQQFVTAKRFIDEHTKGNKLRTIMQAHALAFKLTDEQQAEEDARLNEKINRNTPGTAEHDLIPLHISIIMGEFQGLSDDDKTTFLTKLYEDNPDFFVYWMEQLGFFTRPTIENIIEAEKEINEFCQNQLERGAYYARVEPKQWAKQYEVSVSKAKKQITELTEAGVLAKQSPFPDDDFYKWHRAIGVFPSEREIYKKIVEEVKQLQAVDKQIIKNFKIDDIPPFRIFNTLVDEGVIEKGNTTNFDKDKMSYRVLEEDHAE